MNRGFTPAMFAQMLARVDRFRRDEFDLDDAGYAQLRRDVERWRALALELARVGEPNQTAVTSSDPVTSRLHPGLPARGE